MDTTHTPNTPDWVTWAIDGPERWERIVALAPAAIEDGDVYEQWLDEVRELEKAVMRDSGWPPPPWDVEDDCLRLGLTRYHARPRQ